MTGIDLDAIRAREQAATRGPWGWRGYDTGSVELRTLHSGGMRIISTSRANPCIVASAPDGTDDPWQAELHFAPGACDTCKRALSAPNGLADRIQCEKPENLDTVWAWNSAGFIEPINRWTVRERPYRADVAGTTHPDAEFIAAARADVPALLAEVDRLRAEVERLDALLTQAYDHAAENVGS